MISMINVNGRAAVIDIFCRAISPPENIKIAAVDDCINPQLTLITWEGFIFPWEVMMPSTNVAESAEVTKI